MAKDLVNRYMWLVETLTRHGRLTLAQINQLWMRSDYGNGKPLPRRTFMHYRDNAEQMFDVTIACDKSTFEYYILTPDGSNQRLLNWLMDSLALNETLSNSQAVSARIMLENVPSASNLPQVIEAMKQNRLIRFNYKAYTRSTMHNAIVLEPYFVKIFKQRWYVIGYNRQDQRLKTYALDRIHDLTTLDLTFHMPEGFSAEGFFRDCFGITTNQNDPKHITLRVEPTQAKYFRALPLHPSQLEQLDVDGYSIFTYRMRITYDLREALLSYGSNVEVLDPPELRRLIRHELEKALSLYHPRG